MKFNSRKIKYGAAAAVFTALFVAAVIIFNLFAGYLGDRFNLKFDLTEEGKYTLSEQTEKLLSSLSDDVNIYILSTRAEMEKGDVSKPALETIQRYNAASGGKVKYEFIDPNKNPQFFKKYPKAINSDAMALVIEGKYRYTVVQSSEFAYTLGGNQNKKYYQSEELITAAIAHVSSDGVAAAGFVRGHGEVSPSALLTIFEGNNFRTNEVDLASPVSEEIDNLVISSPSVDYTAEEIANLEEFLSRDGASLYVLWGSQVPALPVLERYLAEWGFEFSPYIICDETNSYQSAATVVVSVVSDEVVDPASVGQLSLLSPGTRPINLTDAGLGYLRTLPLSESSKESFGKLLSADNKISSFNRESGDVSGPFTTAAVAERALEAVGKKGTSRVFAFGSSMAAMEEFSSVSRAFNSSFFTQVVDYANPDTLTVQIAPKVESVYSLYITEGAVTLLGIVLIAIIPLLFFAAGIFVFIRRKNR
ncbi:MAG: GldG family protein [Oscillospiraceae bacterium]|nr:GldG family protein [Oscillospiraceae bacterium]